MEQKTLNFAPQISLDNFLALQLKHILKTNEPVLAYETPEEIAAFKKAIKHLAGESWTSGYDQMLEYTVNAFYDKLTHEEWADFHYEHYINSAKTLDEKALTLIEKYENGFDSEKWDKKIMTLFGLMSTKINTWDQERNTYYLDTSEHNALPEQKRLQTQEYLENKFQEVVIGKWDTHSRSLKIRILTFLIKDYEKKQAFNFLPAKELNTLIENFLPSIKAADILKDITYSDKDYQKKQAFKTVVEAFYTKIFTTQMLSIQEKNHFLYDIVGLDKNHFYQDPGRVRDVIRKGTLDDVRYMLETISFPIGHTTAHSTIMKICDAERVQVGRGIRVASWFLKECEENFEKGKYLFEFFLPHIKFEMETDKKTAQAEGISFLVAYSHKKAKTSTTMQAQLEKLEKAIVNYEKDHLTRKLQMELPLQAELPLVVGESSEPVKRKFKL